MRLSCWYRGFKILSSISQENISSLAGLGYIRHEKSWDKFGELLILGIINLKMEIKKRKMAMVANKVRMEDEDAMDVVFWLNQPVVERLKAVTTLRRHYYTWLNGSFPKIITKVVNKRRI